MFLADSEANAALDSRASGGPDREVGLSLTEPVLAAGLLTNINEPAAADYARVSYPAASWDAASDRSVSGDPVVFADPVTDWGVVGWAFFTDGAGTPTIPQKFAHPVDIKAGGSEVGFTPAITDMTNLLDN